MCSKASTVRAISIRRLESSLWASALTAPSNKTKKQYKRNNIIEYALQENLKEYGWSIEPPKNYKQVYKQQELFR